MSDHWEGFKDLPVMDADLDPDGLEAVRDWAFDDHDVLMLFDAQMDGLETSDLATTMGMVNLHPREWFTGFRAEDRVEANLVLPAAAPAAASVPLVVRTETTLDLRVTDPRALLLAAEEDGWDWESELELEGVGEEDSIVDILERSTPAEVVKMCVVAASWLTCSPADLPGTEQVAWSTSVGDSTAPAV